MNSFVFVHSFFFLIINNATAASTGQTVSVTEETKVNQSIPFTMQLVELSDTYVVFNLTGPKFDSKNNPLDPSKPFNLTIQTETIKSKKSVWSEVIDGFTFNTTLVGNVNDTAKFSYLMKISQLSPTLKYRVIVRGLYSNKTIMYTNPGQFDVTMKALMPLGTVNKQVSLTLQGVNAKTFFVQVDKLVSRNKWETVINSTISASHTNITTLDNLISGKSYSIKLWYMDNNKKVSAVKTITYRG